jgi:hypothetical protein
MLGHADVGTARFQQRIANLLVQQGDACIIHLR